MIDPKLLRQDAAAVAANLARRGFEFDADAYVALDQRRKSLQVETEELRKERNSSSRNIGKAKAQGEDIAPLLAAVNELGDKLDRNEVELQSVLDEIRAIELGLPNLMADDVPTGSTEDDNTEVRRWGTARAFEFEPRDHIELGENLAMLDFETASKISGSRFAVMTGLLARMQRALIQFMLDTHTQEHGYVESYVPFLVQSDALIGTGQLPKFEEDLFKTTTETPFYLIPTAEVPVTNIVRDTIVEADYMPRRYVAHTPCFRSEAGSYGKDTRGMIRQHQFDKVEMVQLVEPETSYDTLEEMRGHAEALLQEAALGAQQQHAAGAADLDDDIDALLAAEGFEQRHRFADAGVEHLLLLHLQALFGLFAGHVEACQVRAADDDGAVLHLLEREFARRGADNGLDETRQAFRDHECGRTRLERYAIADHAGQLRAPCTGSVDDDVRPYLPPSGGRDPAIALALERIERRIVAIDRAERLRLAPEGCRGVVGPRETIVLAPECTDAMWRQRGDQRVKSVPADHLLVVVAKIAHHCRTRLEQLQVAFALGHPCLAG